MESELEFFPHPAQGHPLYREVLGSAKHENSNTEEFYKEKSTRRRPLWTWRVTMPESSRQCKWQGDGLRNVLCPCRHRPGLCLRDSKSSGTLSAFPSALSPGEIGVLLAELNSPAAPWTSVSHFALLHSSSHLPNT